MILRLALLALALGCNLTSPLFAGTDRGSRLIEEAGGAAGVPGVAGPAGAPGIGGAAGIQGIQGIPGIPGTSGLLDFSDFYALMPGDNGATIGAGTAVLFPQDGSTNGVITRTGPSTFNLPTIGSYLVLFQASIGEVGPGAAQLQLSLNGVPIATSVAGRDSGVDQVVGMSIVTTTSPNSILEVISPPMATTPLTLTPIAGGPLSVSAHLVIIRIL